VLRNYYLSWDCQLSTPRFLQSAYVLTSGIVAKLCY